MESYLPAGVDVAAKKLECRIQVGPDRRQPFEVSNDPQGHERAIRRLQSFSQPVRVCLESTGVYGIDFALALHRAEGIEVMVLNPRIARRFAESLGKRSKTDPIDAEVLLDYAARMPFTPWVAPARELFELRALTRRILALTEILIEEKNRLHAAESCAENRIIRRDIEVNIRHLERRIEHLEAQALRLLQKHPKRLVAAHRLASVKGIGIKSAVRILAELWLLPKDLTARQLVAHAGLDPRHFQSGDSVYKKARISKAGNKHLRAILYMPAQVAVQYEPNVKAFYEKLLARGKAKMQAIVAVMRKLLHSIYGMLKTDTDFQGEKFFAIAGN